MKDSQNKLNCWEYFQCGREPNGAHARELGVCPAAADIDADGVNGGTNGGRICWAVAGTHCEGEAQGVRVRRKGTCVECAFYQKVRAEEGFLEYRILKPTQVK